MQATYQRPITWPGSVVACAILCGLVGVSARCLGDVNLGVYPGQQDAVVGEVVEVDLIAFSYESGGETAAGIGAILLWDAEYLELVGFSTDGPYDWLSPRFPDDSNLDGLNAPYLSDEMPDNDGNAYFEVWRRLPPADPPRILANGLLVATFEFAPLQPGLANVWLESEYGVYTETRVMHGTSPGMEITGSIGPPAVVAIEFDCPPPFVEASGPRYLTIAVVEGAVEIPVALRLMGDPENPYVSCLSQFIQLDGTLGDEPAYQYPSEWDTFSITGLAIRPDTTYTVETVCGDVPAGASAATDTDTTWLWGDVDNNGVADSDDVGIVAGVLQGTTSAPIEAVDLAGCATNGRLDTSDVLAAMDAALGHPFGCTPPCENVTFDLDDYLLFYNCLAGPYEPVGKSCYTYDLDQDADVDLVDFQLFDELFWPID